ncbi:MAG: HNH endonuclease [Prolixibacteraceae bacterium]|jgi:putative restriction endonuclease|nr:HNH endonuclease [Prolixibacteraceae bacterium]
MPRNPDWTREELIVAFNLYCTLTFTRINANNKAIKELADNIGRSNNAVAMKLANFARLDPALQARNVSGMRHGGHGEELIWEEFSENWEKRAFESEEILAKYKGIQLESEIDTSDLDEIPIGKERETIIRARVNQGFFRKTILASYKQTCCITGIDVPELLIASHILPWAKNEKERMNPQNGLCLNALHDKAYDKGLITITPDYKIKLSELLKSQINKHNSEFFLPFDDKIINLPGRFLPHREFLEYHVNNIFIK